MLCPAYLLCCNNLPKCVYAPRIFFVGIFYPNKSSALHLFSVLILHIVWSLATNLDKEKGSVCSNLPPPSPEIPRQKWSNWSIFTPTPPPLRLDILRKLFIHKKYLHICRSLLLCILCTSEPVFIEKTQSFKFKRTVSRAWDGAKILRKTPGLLAEGNTLWDTAYQRAFSLGTHSGGAS